MLVKAFYLVLVIVLSSIKVSATYYRDLSSLEKSIVDEGLATFELIPVEHAEGLVVRKIYIFTAPPFSVDSGFLTILNHLHINTKENVVRQELFQKEDMAFDDAAIRDSEMALRMRGLVRSLAVIVPARRKNSQNKNEIDLLVVTKDLLSLQPTFGFSGSGMGKDFTITNLTVALSENNFLGYNKSIAGIYEFQQAGHILSARYFDPQFFNSRFQLNVKPSLIFARNTFEFAGFLEDLKLEKPLLSEADRFGYGIDLAYGRRPVIDFQGKKIRTIDIPTNNGVLSIEKKYYWHYGKGSLFGRISFGRTYKNELFGSYNLHIKRPSIPKELHIDEAKQEYFKKNALPKEELESFITLGYSYFQNSFLTLYDYNNYKLQEIARTGPKITVSNDFSSKKILISDTNFLRPKLKAAFLQPLFQDSFIHVTATTTTRYDSTFRDNLFKSGISLVSPKIYGLGRVIGEGQLSLLYHDRDNKKFVLGADSGIRGVDSRFYSGSKGFSTNLEFRSAPIAIWIFYAGFVIFYDVGAAFDRWSEANATHAVGFGFRILTPQVSSVPFRIDFAFPVHGRGKDKHIMVPSFGTGQAF